MYWWKIVSTTMMIGLVFGEAQSRRREDRKAKGKKKKQKRFFWNSKGKAWLAQRHIEKQSHDGVEFM